MIDQERIHDAVRERYAEAARVATAGRTDSAAKGSCCSADASNPVWGELLYDDADRTSLPDATLLASLG